MEEKLLHRDSIRALMMYDEFIRENDPYSSYSQSEEPRNLKQVQNRQYIKNTTKAQQPVSH